MKVSGPGKGPPAEATAVEGTDKAAKPARTGEAGKAFADKLAGSRAPSAAKAGGSVTADIAAELKAGKLRPAAAIDKVVERVLERQLGADAPAPVREQVRAALRDALENDPALAEKVRDLAR